MKNNGMKRSIELLGLFFVVMLVAFQFNLHPFSSLVPRTDSSVFLYIGKQMHIGFLPYRDMFDHKGPLLYLIQYIGFFANDTIGIWILECLNLFLVVYCIKKMCELYQLSVLQKLSIFLFVVGVSGINVYSGGNLVEEYALPAITYALFIFLKLYHTRVFSRKDICVLGGMFAIVTLLRQNMIGVWCAYIPVVVCYLICTRQLKILLKSVTWFIEGLVIVYLPFLLYFLFTGTLQDMIDCYYRFNFVYAAHSFSLYNFADAVFKLICQIRWGCLPIVVALFMNEDRGIVLLNLLGLIVSSALASMSGNIFSHYAIVIIPFVIIPSVVCMRYVEKIGYIRQWFRDSVNSVLFFVVVVTFLFQSQEMYSFGAIKPDENTITTRHYIDCHSLKKSNILIFGNSCFDYLYCDVATKNKFFYQIPPILINYTLYDKFLCEIKKNYPEVVFVNKMIDKKETEQIIKITNDKRFLTFMSDLVGNKVYDKECYGGMIVYRRKHL